MESPFDILSIDPDADEEEVERAYRQRVKETHPDHGGTAGEFQLVRAAYEEITAGEPTDEWTVDRTDAPGDDDDADHGPEGTRVEYLNYEVLDDHGWALDDDDLFETAATANLDPADRGRLLVRPDETLLEAAENRGFTWPFACRGGACANCAVAVLRGDLSMPVNHILPSEMTDRGIRLSCVGAPTTDDTTVVFNVKHLPDLDELRLPPRPFRQANPDQ